MTTTPNDPKINILPAQARAARGLLFWSQDQLAERSGVSKQTLMRFELEKTLPHPRTVEAIRAALEAAGVMFIQENGDGPGVRLKKDQSGA